MIWRTQIENCLWGRKVNFGWASSVFSARRAESIIGTRDERREILKPMLHFTLRALHVSHICEANYPHLALKGGYFLFLWAVGTRLDLMWKQPPSPCTGWFLMELRPDPRFIFFFSLFALGALLTLLMKPLCYLDAARKLTSDQRSGRESDARGRHPSVRIVVRFAGRSIVPIGIALPINMLFPLSAVGIVLPIAPAPAAGGHSDRLLWQLPSRLSEIAVVIQRPVVAVCLIPLLAASVGAYTWALRCCHVLASVLEERSDVLLAQAAEIVTRGQQLQTEAQPAVRTLFYLQVARHHCQHIATMQTDILRNSSSSTAVVGR